VTNQKELSNFCCCCLIITWSELVLRQKLSFPYSTAGLFVHQELCGICLKDWGDSEAKKTRALKDQIFIIWEPAAQVTSFLRLTCIKHCQI